MFIMAFCVPILVVLGSNTSSLLPRLTHIVDGNALPFDGVYVNYKRTGLTANNFQAIEAGQTVTVSVNAAKSYKLKGVKTAKVSAIQGFRYATGAEAPSALKGLAFCADQTTGSVEVTPNQATAAE